MATNLIIDGQFNPDIFQSWVPSDVDLVTNPAEENNYCHLAAQGRIEQTIQHTVGETYVFAFYSRAPQGGKVSILDPYLGTVYITETIPSSDDWTYNQFSVTPVEGWAATVSINFQAPSNNTLDIDNVVMQQI